MPEDGSQRKGGDEPEEMTEEMREELAEEAADRGPESEKGMDEADLGYDEQAEMPTTVMADDLAEEAADRGPDPEGPMAAGDLGYPETAEEPAPPPVPASVPPEMADDLAEEAADRGPSAENVMSCEEQGYKSPVKAAALSILPGLGHIYNGNMAKAVLFLVAACVGLMYYIIPGLVIIAYAMYDAYRTSYRMNRNEIPWRTPVQGGYVVYFLLIILAVAGYLWFAGESWQFLTGLLMGQ
ncbi:hypothetical protein AZH53_09025 [Methanomicrobiaceae archaeon CYW5]|uniref:hypothetical protein n=1 Tax=Methanovulcanius yangii TaxID=1789227 RepID=UPI0029C9CD11|nr:hypothetical protein [Methanovulcanius yangii]MBT8508545.1 hypothetical protein [Methanovulcanius yangii]